MSTGRLVLNHDRNIVEQWQNVRRKVLNHP
jgi:hypothetical protein